MQGRSCINRTTANNMEVTGLVIGGVALASLFDSCMSMLNYIDTGRNYAQDYQQAILKVTLLAKRLDIWERTYRARNPPSTLQDGLNAQRALREIERLLQKAKDSGTPYIAREQREENAMAVATIADQVQSQNITYRQRNSFLTKVRWAFSGKDQINTIVVNLSFFIDNLEQISKNAVAADRQQAVATDALALTQPGCLGAAEESVGIVKEAASTVFPQLASAISDRQHRFGAHTVTGEATLIQGDYVEPGSQVNGYGHSYDGMNISGKAKVFNGNTYSTKSPFANW